MNTSAQLRELFNFHHFQANDKLEAIIKDTESRYSGIRVLGEDELAFVNAAGDCSSQYDLNRGSWDPSKDPVHYVH